MFNRSKNKCCKCGKIRAVNQNQTINFDELSNVEIIKRAENDAQELLSDIWETDEIPIDPFKIAYDLGIKTHLSENMPPEISGAIQKKKDGSVVAVINEMDGIKR